MLQVLPLKAFKATLTHIGSSISPPYDVVSRSQVRAYTKDNPLHFLNVTRPEGLLDESIPFDDARVYQAANEHWQRLLNDDIFTQDETPHYYIYAMQEQGNKQYGLVALTSVFDYEKGLVRKHELTRPDKENDRVRHIQAVNGQLSPVLLTVKDTGGIADLLKSCAQGEPCLSAELNDVLHELWVVESPEHHKKIQALFEAQEVIYVADGHHRTAAALRAYEASGHHPYCLAVIMPSHQMKILGYHRVVADLNGLTPADFLKSLEQHYLVEPLADLSFPQEHGVCHMMLGRDTYALTRKDTHETDAVLSLDVSALSRFILTPILGIDDIRTNPRIGFVGGQGAVAEIKAQIEQGEAAVGFVMYPTQMDELLAVADANKLMPPKSTWFEPKLADGMVCYGF